MQPPLTINALFGPRAGKYENLTGRPGFSSFCYHLCFHLGLSGCRCTRLQRGQLNRQSKTAAPFLRSTARSLVRCVSRALVATTLGVLLNTQTAPIARAVEEAVESSSLDISVSMRRRTGHRSCAWRISGSLRSSSASTLDVPCETNYDSMSPQSVCSSSTCGNTPRMRM